MDVKNPNAKIVVVVQYANMDVNGSDARNAVVLVFVNMVN
jgi:hypothetical protein